MPTRKQLFITAAIIFIANSCLPGVILGDIAFAEIVFGFLIPWLAVDVRYGQRVLRGNFYHHGSIEKIEGFHILWPQLLLAVALSIILAAILIIIGKGLVHFANKLFGRRIGSS
jgi:hypothetical protein